MNYRALTRELKPRVLLRIGLPTLLLFATSGEPCGAIDLNFSVFGSAVALDEQFLVVGASGERSGRGSVYVFRRGPRELKLATKLSVPAPAESFGSALSLDSETLAVGAPITSTGQGQVWVFRRGSLRQPFQSKPQRIVAPDAQPYSYFGEALAVAGDMLVVGAPRTLDGVGAVYVFKYDRNWDFQQRLNAPAGQTQPGLGVQFGSSVAFDGRTLVVGSSMYDEQPLDNRGAAYIYVLREDGAFPDTPERTLEPGGTPRAEFFGRTAAVHRAVAVVGASLTDVGDAENQGSAYVFERQTDGDFNETPVVRLSPDRSESKIGFGTAVAISENGVLVGAQSYPVDGNLSQGAAFFYSRGEDGRIPGKPTQMITAPDGAKGDNFGVSVAVKGTTLVVGATASEAGGSPDGAVYLFERQGQGDENTYQVTHRITPRDGIKPARPTQRRRDR